MYCQTCGQEVRDDAVVCIHCGCALRHPRPNVNTVEPLGEVVAYTQSKTGVGVLCGLFLGILGLILGICLYPSGTVARKTFIKAWGITFGVFYGIAMAIYIGAIIYCVTVLGVDLDSIML